MILLVHYVFLIIVSTPWLQEGLVIFGNFPLGEAEKFLGYRGGWPFRRAEDLMQLVRMHWRNFKKLSKHSIQFFLLCIREAFMATLVVISMYS